MTTTQARKRRPDGRTREAKRFKAIVAELTAQLGRTATATEETMIVAIAQLRTLLDRDSEALQRGENVPDSRIRRNMAQLRAAMIALGLADKSRDITKASRARGGASMLSLTAGE